MRYLNDYTLTKMQNRMRDHLVEVIFTRRYDAISKIHSGEVLNYVYGDVGTVTAVLLGGFLLFLFITVFRDKFKRLHKDMHEESGDDKTHPS